MIRLLAITLLATIPYQGVIVDETDAVEINHVYDGNAKKTFTQIIWYEFDEKTGAHQIVDWRMMRHKGMRPIKDERDGIYKAIFHDTTNGNCWRRVNAKSFTESNTQYDVECVQRGQWPIERRRKLKEAKKH